VRSCFLDLSLRLKLRFSGPDALRFLNGQISNDLRKARSDFAIQASVLTAKGKLNAIIFISGQAESFFLDAAPEVQQALPARIDRYLVADDVQMEDITAGYAIFHVISDSAPIVTGVSRIVRADRFGCVGWDIWAEHSTIDSVRKQLMMNNSFCDEESSEVFRIERGIPRWGRELTEQIIPIEAGLESSAKQTSACVGSFRSLDNHSALGCASL
jgi:folate-binding Fe-S cluster repair protein YgfZ